MQMIIRRFWANLSGLALTNGGGSRLSYTFTTSLRVNRALSLLEHHTNRVCERRLRVDSPLLRQRSYAHQSAILDLSKMDSVA